MKYLREDLTVTYTWKVSINDNFLGYAYAPTEKDAKYNAFIKNGCASQYTGITADDVSIERIN